MRASVSVHLYIHTYKHIYIYTHIHIQTHMSVHLWDGVGWGGVDGGMYIYIYTRRQCIHVSSAGVLFERSLSDWLEPSFYRDLETGWCTQV